MFDLSSIIETDTAKLELLHPETHTPIGATITLAGEGHPKRRKIQFARSRLLRQRVAKRGKLELTDPAEDEEYETERLVACTLGWDGIARDGKPIPCTPEEAQALYESVAWIRRQALAFLEDTANFLRSTDAP